MKLDLESVHTSDVPMPKILPIVILEINGFGIPINVAMLINYVSQITL